MSEQMYARLLPHGKRKTHRSANGTRFMKAPNANDLTSCWQPIDAATLVELRNERHGAGPNAPCLFEFMSESELKGQARLAKKQSGVAIPGMDLTDDDQKMAIQKLEFELAQERRAAVEREALHAAQQQSTNNQLAQLTAMMQKLMGGAPPSAEPSLPTIGAGASGDIADPKAVAPTNAATTPGTEPKTSTKRGGKPKEETTAPQMAMPAAPQAAPVEVKPFVASSGTVTE